MQEQIQQLIAEHNLGRVANPIAAALLPAIHLSKSESNDLETGSSRIGGLPDVPPEFEWLRWRGRPLGFLAQINCLEIQPYDVAHVLPSSGMLYFFYDMVEQPWGYDPADRGSSAVIYVPTTQGLTQASLPAGENTDELCFSPFRLEFRIVASLPQRESVAFEQMSLTDQEADNYFNLLEAMTEQFIGEEPLHQLLGHAHTIQGDMQLECQLVSHGLYCGDSSGYTDPRANALRPGAAEWRLLFQMDTDQDLGAMWGDVGIVFFWMRESSLRKRQFDQVWAVLQCC